jgi:hypothetical protein
VDRLVIFQTQVPLGAGAIKSFERIKDLHIKRIVATRRFGDDEMTIYALDSK